MVASSSNFSPLLIDLYEFTMSQGFLHTGIGDQRAIFHHFFRRLPTGCLAAVAAGLAPFLEWLQNLRFGSDQLEALQSFRNQDGSTLFTEAYLRKLEHWQCELDIFAMPEGTLCFPHQPLVRVEGPLWQAQLLETALLNYVNFSTLVASLTLPILQAAGETPVWEFGARRAQGPNGALLASRSAWLAGCAGTSFVEAALRDGIPATGTMAHSWVMAFESEQQAFQSYAECYPQTTALLIDTFNLEQGALHAVETAKWLQKHGRSLQAVRIDSGDLAAGSQLVRRILNENGCSDVKIILSGDLNAEKIHFLRQHGAQVDVWGVGTEIACAASDPHLTGVYKLAALQLPDGNWKPCAKTSQDPAKQSRPGRRTVRRCLDTRGVWCVDETVDLLNPSEQGEKLYIYPHHTSVSELKVREDLLPQIVGNGKPVSALPDVKEVQERLRTQLRLWSGACPQG